MPHVPSTTSTALAKFVVLCTTGCGSMGVCDRLRCGGFMRYDVAASHPRRKRPQIKDRLQSLSSALPSAFSGYLRVTYWDGGDLHPLKDRHGGNSNSCSGGPWLEDQHLAFMQRVLTPIMGCTGHCATLFLCGRRLWSRANTRISKIPLSLRSQGVSTFHVDFQGVFIPSRRGTHGDP